MTRAEFADLIDEAQRTARRQARTARHQAEEDATAARAALLAAWDRVNADAAPTIDRLNPPAPLYNRND